MQGKNACVNVAKEHPEYFVDGTLIMKCAEEGIIPLEVAVKVIGEQEYKEYQKALNLKTK